MSRDFGWIPGRQPEPNPSTAASSRASSSHPSASFAGGASFAGSRVTRMNVPHHSVSSDAAGDRSRVGTPCGLCVAGLNCPLHRPAASGVSISQRGPGADRYSRDSGLSGSSRIAAGSTLAAGGSAHSVAPAQSVRRVDGGDAFSSFLPAGVSPVRPRHVGAGGSPRRSLWDTTMSSPSGLSEWSSAHGLLSSDTVGTAAFRASPTAPARSSGAATVMNAVPRERLGLFEPAPGAVSPPHRATLARVNRDTDSFAQSRMTAEVGSAAFHRSHSHHAYLQTQTLAMFAASRDAAWMSQSPVRAPSVADAVADVGHHPRRPSTTPARSVAATSTAATPAWAAATPSGSREPFGVSATTPVRRGGQLDVWMVDDVALTPRTVTPPSTQDPRSGHRDGSARMREQDGSVHEWPTKNEEHGSQPRRHRASSEPRWATSTGDALRSGADHRLPARLRAASSSHEAGLDGSSWQQDVSVPLEHAGLKHYPLRGSAVVRGDAWVVDGLDDDGVGELSPAISQAQGPDGAPSPHRSPETSARDNAQAALHQPTAMSHRTPTEEVISGWVPSVRDASAIAEPAGASHGRVVVGRSRSEDLRGSVKSPLDPSAAVSSLDPFEMSDAAAIAAHYRDRQPRHLDDGRSASGVHLPESPTNKLMRSATQMSDGAVSADARVLHEDRVERSLAALAQGQNALRQRRLDLLMDLADASGDVALTAHALSLAQVGSRAASVGPKESTATGAETGTSNTEEEPGPARSGSLDRQAAITAAAVARARARRRESVERVVGNTSVDRSAADSAQPEVDLAPVPAHARACSVAVQVDEFRELQLQPASPTRATSERGAQTTVVRTATVATTSIEVDATYSSPLRAPEEGRTVAGAVGPDEADPAAAHVAPLHATDTRDVTATFSAFPSNPAETRHVDGTDTATADASPPTPTSPKSPSRSARRSEREREKWTAALFGPHAHRVPQRASSRPRSALSNSADGGSLSHVSNATAATPLQTPMAPGQPHLLPTMTSEPPAVEVILVEGVAPSHVPQPLEIPPEADTRDGASVPSTRQPDQPDDGGSDALALTPHYSPGAYSGHAANAHSSGSHHPRDHVNSYDSVGGSGIAGAVEPLDSITGGGGVTGATLGHWARDSQQAGSFSTNVGVDALEGSRMGMGGSPVGNDGGGGGFESVGRVASALPPPHPPPDVSPPPAPVGGRGELTPRTLTASRFAALRYADAALTPAAAPMGDNGSEAAQGDALLPPLAAQAGEITSPGMEASDPARSHQPQIVSALGNGLATPQYQLDAPDDDSTVDGPHTGASVSHEDQRYDTEIPFETDAATKRLEMVDTSYGPQMQQFRSHSLPAEGGGVWPHRSTSSAVYELPPNEGHREPLAALHHPLASDSPTPGGNWTTDDGAGVDASAFAPWAATGGRVTASTHDEVANHNPEDRSGAPVRSLDHVHVAVSSAPEAPIESKTSSVVLASAGRLRRVPSSSVSSTPDALPLRSVTSAVPDAVSEMPNDTAHRVTSSSIDAGAETASAASSVAVTSAVPPGFAAPVHGADEGVGRVDGAVEVESQSLLQAATFPFASTTTNFDTDISDQVVEAAVVSNTPDWAEDEVALEHRRALERLEALRAQKAGLEVEADFARRRVALQRAEMSERLAAAAAEGTAREAVADDYAVSTATAAELDRQAQIVTMSGENVSSVTAPVIAASGAEVVESVVERRLEGNHWQPRESFDDQRRQQQRHAARRAVEIEGVLLLEEVTRQQLDAVESDARFFIEVEFTASPIASAPSRPRAQTPLQFGLPVTPHFGLPIAFAMDPHKSPAGSGPPAGMGPRITIPSPPPQTEGKAAAAPTTPTSPPRILRRPTSPLAGAAAARGRSPGPPVLPASRPDSEAVDEPPRSPGVPKRLPSPVGQSLLRPLTPRSPDVKGRSDEAHSDEPTSVLPTSAPTDSAVVADAAPDAEAHFEGNVRVQVIAPAVATPRSFSAQPVELPVAPSVVPRAHSRGPEMVSQSSSLKIAAIAPVQDETDGDRPTTTLRTPVQSPVRNIDSTPKEPPRPPVALLDATVVEREVKDADDQAPAAVAAAVEPVVDEGGKYTRGRVAAISVPEPPQMVGDGSTPREMMATPDSPRVWRQPTPGTPTRSGAFGPSVPTTPLAPEGTNSTVLTRPLPAAPVPGRLPTTATSPLRPSSRGISPMRRSEPSAANASDTTPASGAAVASSAGNPDATQLQEPGEATVPTTTAVEQAPIAFSPKVESRSSLASDPTATIGGIPEPIGSSVAGEPLDQAALPASADDELSRDERTAPVSAAVHVESIEPERAASAIAAIVADRDDGFLATPEPPTELQLHGTVSGQDNPTSLVANIAPTGVSGGPAEASELLPSIPPPVAKLESTSVEAVLASEIAGAVPAATAPAAARSSGGAASGSNLKPLEVPAAGAEHRNDPLVESFEGWPIHPVEPSQTPTRLSPSPHDGEPSQPAATASAVEQETETVSALQPIHRATLEAETAGVEPPGLAPASVGQSIHATDAAARHLVTIQSSLELPPKATTDEASSTSAQPPPAQMTLEATEVVADAGTTASSDATLVTEGPTLHLFDAVVPPLQTADDAARRQASPPERRGPSAYDLPPTPTESALGGAHVYVPPTPRPGDAFVPGESPHEWTYPVPAEAPVPSGVHATPVSASHHYHHDMGSAGRNLEPSDGHFAREFATPPDHGLGSAAHTAPPDAPLEQAGVVQISPHAAPSDSAPRLGGSADGSRSDFAGSGSRHVSPAMPLPPSTAEGLDAPPAPHDEVPELLASTSTSVEVSVRPDPERAARPLVWPVNYLATKHAAPHEALRHAAATTATAVPQPENVIPLVPLEPAGARSGASAAVRADSPRVWRLPTPLDRQISPSASRHRSSTGTPTIPKSPQPIADSPRPLGPLPAARLFTAAVSPIRPLDSPRRVEVQAPVPRRSHSQARLIPPPPPSTDTEAAEHVVQVLPTPPRTRPMLRRGPLVVPSAGRAPAANEHDAGWPPHQSPTSPNGGSVRSSAYEATAAASVHTPDVSRVPAPLEQPQVPPVERALLTAPGVAAESTRPEVVVGDGDVLPYFGTSPGGAASRGGGTPIRPPPPRVPPPHGLSPTAAQTPLSAQGSPLVAAGSRSGTPRPPPPKTPPPRRSSPVVAPLAVSELTIPEGDATPVRRFGSPSTAAQATSMRSGSRPPPPVRSPPKRDSAAGSHTGTPLSARAGLSSSPAAVSRTGTPRPPAPKSPPPSRRGSPIRGPVVDASMPHQQALTTTAGTSDVSTSYVRRYLPPPPVTPIKGDGEAPRIEPAPELNVAPAGAPSGAFNSEAERWPQREPLAATAVYVAAAPLSPTAIAISGSGTAAAAPSPSSRFASRRLTLSRLLPPAPSPVLATELTAAATAASDDVVASPTATTVVGLRLAPVEAAAAESRSEAARQHSASSPLAPAAAPNGGRFATRPTATASTATTTMAFEGSTDNAIALALQRCTAACEQTNAAALDALDSLAAAARTRTDFDSNDELDPADAAELAAATAHADATVWTVLCTVDGVTDSLAALRAQAVAVATTAAAARCNASADAAQALWSRRQRGAVERLLLEKQRLQAEAAALVHTFSRRGQAGFESPARRPFQFSLERSGNAASPATTNLDGVLSLDATGVAATTTAQLLDAAERGARFPDPRDSITDLERQLAAEAAELQHRLDEEADALTLIGAFATRTEAALGVDIPHALSPSAQDEARRRLAAGLSAELRRARRTGTESVAALLDAAPQLPQVAAACVIGTCATLESDYREALAAAQADAALMVVIVELFRSLASTGLERLQLSRVTHDDALAAAATSALEVLRRTAGTTSGGTGPAAEIAAGSGGTPLGNDPLPFNASLSGPAWGFSASHHGSGWHTPSAHATPPVTSMPSSATAVAIAAADAALWAAGAQLLPSPLPLPEERESTWLDVADYERAALDYAPGSASHPTSNTTVADDPATRLRRRLEAVVATANGDGKVALGTGSRSLNAPFPLAALFLHPTLADVALRAVVGSSFGDVGAVTSYRPSGVSSTLRLLDSRGRGAFAALVDAVAAPSRTASAATSLAAGAGYFAVEPSGIHSGQLLVPSRRGSLVNASDSGADGMAPRPVLADPEVQAAVQRLWRRFGAVAFAAPLEAAVAAALLQATASAQTASSGARRLLLTEQSLRCAARLVKPPAGCGSVMMFQTSGSHHTDDGVPSDSPERYPCPDDSTTAEHAYPSTNSLSVSQAGAATTGVALNDHTLTWLHMHRFHRMVQRHANRNHAVLAATLQRLRAVRNASALHTESGRKAVWAQVRVLVQRGPRALRSRMCHVNAKGGAEGNDSMVGMAEVVWRSSDSADDAPPTAATLRSFFDAHAECAMALTLLQQSAAFAHLVRDAAVNHHQTSSLTSFQLPPDAAMSLAVLRIAADALHATHADLDRLLKA